NADHANAVIASGSNCSGYVRAMAMMIDRIVALRRIERAGADKIPTTHVVDVTVVIIVDPIARNFAGVSPDIGSQVGVRVVDSRIYSRYYDSRARSRIPGRGGTDLLNAPQVRVGLAP